jgi:hypothetical protein
VWRHSDIVVASLKSLLHKGHAMHAASLSLFTFTIWLAIIVTFFFLLDLTLTRPHKTNTSASLLTYPHGACHQYATNHELFRRCGRETTAITKKLVHTYTLIVIVGVGKFSSIGSVSVWWARKKKRQSVGFWSIQRGSCSIWTMAKGLMIC